MRLSNLKGLSMATTDGSVKRARVDRVTVIVVACFLGFSVVRGVIPALIGGTQIGMALLVVGLGGFALALALLPAWHRRARRVRGGAKSSASS